MTGGLLDLLADVLEGARKKGATEADAYVGEDQSFSAQVRMGQVDTVKHARDQHLRCRRLLANRRGHGGSVPESIEVVAAERLCDERKCLPQENGGIVFRGRPIKELGGSFSQRRVRSEAGDFRNR